MNSTFLNERVVPEKDFLYNVLAYANLELHPVSAKDTKLSLSCIDDATIQIFCSTPGYLETKKTPYSIFEPYNIQQIGYNSYTCNLVNTSCFISFNQQDKQANYSVDFSIFQNIRMSVLEQQEKRKKSRKTSISTIVFNLLQ